MSLRSGRTEGLPYSLSRWTDVPAAKWAWFLESLEQRKMVAFDPRTAVPGVWSLDPEDTLGLIFWTKDPSNLIRAKGILEPYRVQVHVTVTGWHEVEKGAPDINEGSWLLKDAVRAFGAENVTWRFSPVPVVTDVIERFEFIAAVAAAAGVRSVYLSFLQPNDLVPEDRSREDRLELLVGMAREVDRLGMRVVLCNEDRLLSKVSELPSNLGTGVCAAPTDWGQPEGGRLPSEGCGCVLMVDPFTINESCTMGCRYCYAADKTLSDKKRNTTKHLNVVR